jgi:hypothetical protein
MKRKGMGYKLVLSSIALGLLVGCATTYPVVAVVERTGERFFGEASSIGTGSSFTLASADGITCTGSYDSGVVFDYTTGSSSRGNIICSDGRTGTWVTTGTAVGGQGAGVASVKVV